MCRQGSVVVGRTSPNAMGGRAGMEPASETTGQPQKMTLGLLPELEEHRHDGVTPRFKAIQRMAQEAEDAGLDTFWLADHFFYEAPDKPRVGQWEAFTFLSAIASTT